MITRLILASWLLVLCPLWAHAGPSITASDLIHFTNVNGAVEIGFHRAKITNTSAGTSDPLVGAWQTLSVPSGANNYDYVLVAQTAPGVWSLTSTEADLYLSMKPSNYLTASVLSGNTRATVIDFNTGTIAWSPVTNLTVDNTIGSGTLAAFGNYSSAALQFSFATDDALRNWVNNPLCTLTRSFSSTLTATPEPGTWLLWSVAVILLGVSGRKWGWLA